MSEKINFKKPNLLQSKVNDSLVVLSVPSSTDNKEYFRGVILTVENSVSGNTPLQISHHYRKEKFELYKGDELLVKLKSK